MKGEFNKECNRTNCSNNNATYYNHSTLKYYCQSCAITINIQNRQDAIFLFGHDLCIEHNAPSQINTFFTTPPEFIQFELPTIRENILPKKIRKLKVVKVRNTPKINRNDHCPYGSGLKFKKCCIDK